MYSSIAEILSSSTNLSPILSQCQGYSKMLRRVTGRKKKVYLPQYRLLLIQRILWEKKNLFFSYFFFINCLKKNPHMFLSWKLNQLGYLILYPYWILSSTCIKAEMVICYFTYLWILYASGAKGNTFLNQSAHTVLPVHPLSWVLSILHWNHAYLFQTENISYFLYILIHRFLNYTERQPLLSNKYQWSTKLTAPGSSFKEMNLITSAAAKMNDPIKNYWLLQILLYFKKRQG